MNLRLGYGWRARIGYLNPQTVAEGGPYELYRVAPEGVLFCFTCCGLSAYTTQAIELARSRIVEAAREVAARGVDIVIQAGIPLLLGKGSHFHQELTQAIEKATGLPAITDLGAALEAFQALGVRKLVVGTPWAPQFDVQLKSYLEDHGLEVLKIQCLDVSAVDMVALPLQAPYKLARELYLECPEAEAIYLPAGGWGTILNIELLERDLKRPVVTANQSAMWAALRRLHLQEPIEGYGKLLRELM